MRRDQPRDWDGRFLPCDREIRSRRVELRLTPSEYHELYELADRQKRSVTETVVGLFPRRRHAPYTVPEDCWTPPNKSSIALAKARGLW